MSGETRAPGPSNVDWVAGRSIWRRARLRVRFWDSVFGLAMLGSIVCIPLLGARNRRLATRLAAVEDSALALRTLSTTFGRNVQLSAFEGAKLPPIILSRLTGSARPEDREAGGAVIMVYTPMACERSIRDGLRSLADTTLLQRRGLAPFAVVVERGQRDRERALLWKEDGHLTFPFVFVPADSLISVLVPKSDSAFDEEPIYFLVDRHFTIRSAFHGDQRRPDLLNRWLEAIR